MREWITGCLKSGGSKLSQTPRSCSSARRALHGSFWKHGAGDIRLPAWWTLWLQFGETSPSNGHDDGEAKSSSSQCGLDRIFYDFLYPFKTRALVKRLDHATALHRQAASLALQQSRRYTSVAEGIITGEAGRNQVVTDQRANEENRTLSEYELDGLENELTHLLSERLSDSPALDKQISTIVDRDTDFIRQAHTELSKLSEKRARAYSNAVFLRLIKSSHASDVDHALETFRTLSKSNVSAAKYKLLVRACIKHKKFDFAYEHWVDAVEKFPASLIIGTPELLLALIKHKLWREAISVWYRFAQSDFLYRTLEQDLWADVQRSRSRKLVQYTLDAAYYAGNLKATVSSEKFDIAVDFVKSLFLRTIDKWTVSREPKRISVMLRRLRPLLGPNDLDLVEKAFYKYQTVDVAAYDQIAIELYEEMRRMPLYRPSLLLMNILTKMFHRHGSVSGSWMVLDDHEKNRLEATQYTNSLLADTFADHGDVDALERVFQNFQQRSFSLDDHNTPLYGQQICNHMIRVHVRRADPAMAVDTFRRLQSEHHFRPNGYTYGYIIQAYAAVADVENAVLWLQKMEKQGLRPDNTDFAAIMNIYAKRGDIEAVEDMYEEFRNHGGEVRGPMLKALVLGHVMANQHAKAEVVVKKISSDVEPDVQTHVWNLLLHAAAFSRNIEKLNALRAEMEAIGVCQNHYTINAVLYGLCKSRWVDRAWVVLRIWMEDQPIPRTAMHYALVMGGFLSVRQEHKVEEVYKHMIEKQIVPDINVLGILLRAAARQDRKEGSWDNKHQLRVQRVFEAAVPLLNSASFASLTSRMFITGEPLKQAFYSLPYEYMIALYGSEGALNAVGELFEGYLGKSNEPSINNDPEYLPVRMLSALITIHRRSENDEELERCWQLARQQSRRLFRRLAASLDEPGWVIRARRFALNLVLREYLHFLRRGNQTDRIVEIVNELEWDGFELNGLAVNQYVQALTVSKKPEHHYLAFEICERDLVQHWPGWLRVGVKRRPMEKFFWARSAQMVSDPNFRFPQYRTLIGLAGVLTFARSGEWLPDNEVSRKRLSEIAPRTTSIITGLPRIPDGINLR